MPSQYRFKRVRNITLISAALYTVLPVGTQLQNLEGKQFYKGVYPLDVPPDFRGEHKITWVGFPARSDDPEGNFTGPYRNR